MKQFDIEPYIPKGRENAVNRNILCDLTGMSDRCNRNAIRLARQRGVPICIGKNGGYYIAENDEELCVLLSDMYARATDIMATARRLQRLHQSKKQLALDGGVKNG